LVKAPNDENAFILKAQQGFADGRYLILDHCQQLLRQLRSEVYDQSARGERRRRYSQRFHILAAWKYGIMTEPERLAVEPPQIVRPRYPSRSRTGY
jgi:hypothetical protein